MPVLFLAIFLVACAGPSHRALNLPPTPGIGVAEATRIAARAMQEIGFWPTSQDETTGFLRGEKTEKITLGMETMTIYLAVKVMEVAPGTIRAAAECSVSSNMAYWDEGGECVDRFESAFNRLIVEAARNRVRHPPPSDFRPAPAPEPVVPVEPGGPAGGKEYSL